MKTRLYPKTSIAIVILASFCVAACQQIPDVEEFLEEVPVEEPFHYDKLIREVGIALPFSVHEIGTMIYQFSYDENQRIKTIDLKAEYATGEEHESHATYTYNTDDVLMNTSGTDLYTGQLNGITEFNFIDGRLNGYICHGIEYIPDYSFGRTNVFVYENDLLASVLSNGSGEDLSFTRTYEWTDGNIIREITSDSYGESFEISYNYTGYIDKSNLDLLKLAYYLNYYKGLYFTADKVTFNDLSSKYLPAEQIQFAGEETYTFEYEFDADQYVKKVYIYIEGELFQIMTINYTDEEPSDFPQDSSLNISEALGMPDGTDVTISGTVVAVTQRGFLLGDGTEMLYVYGGPEWNLCVEKADRVKVSGKMSTYWNNREIKLNNVEVKGQGILDETTPYQIKASNIGTFALSDYKPCMIQLEGILAHGTYGYIIQMNESDILISLEFPLADLSSYLGKTVSITGYYLWTSTGETDNLVVEVILDDLTVAGTSSPASNTANCYIVSSSGIYSFDTVKGNSTESVGKVASAEVLWESFGTDVAPSVGDLISSVSYSSDKISYTVASPFKEGNAVIAAKDASGTILWSWHIWMTDMPEEQVYANNAGILMDRNLGATSATPGDVGTYGLYYQWGRKDPFLGATNNDQESKSTNIWPSSVKTSSTTGTIDYAIKHPMTFISYSAVNYDWCMTSDYTRWGSDKTIYDPCPSGWRVPDGGREGFWAKSGLMNSDTNDYYHWWTYQSQYDGMIFNQPYCLQSVWYPSTGQRHQEDGRLYGVSLWGVYHAISPQFWYSEGFDFSASYYYVEEAGPSYATGAAVRCLKE